MTPSPSPPAMPAELSAEWLRGLRTCVRLSQGTPSLALPNDALKDLEKVIDAQLAALSRQEQPPTVGPDREALDMTMVRLLAAIGTNRVTVDLAKDAVQRLAAMDQENAALRQQLASSQVELPQGVKRIHDQRLKEIMSGYADFPAPDYFETSSLAYEVRNWRMGSPPTVEPPQDVREIVEGLREMCEFLRGAGTLSGCSFGEKPVGARGEFWWREPLRKTVDRAITALSTLSRQSGRGEARWVPWKPGDALPAPGVYWVTEDDGAALVRHCYANGWAARAFVVTAYWSEPVAAPYEASPTKSEVARDE